MRRIKEGRVLREETWSFLFPVQRIRSDAPCVTEELCFQIKYELCPQCESKGA